MCAIIGWSGKLPQGLLSSLLTESSSRGRDGTGLAYRARGDDGNMRNFVVKDATAAECFMRTTVGKEQMSNSRRSFRGIGHTRRASPGMPKFSAGTAHPFKFERMFFAHNGMVSNWREIKSALESKYAALGEAFESRRDAVSKIEIDSQVLGPLIWESGFDRVDPKVALDSQAGQLRFDFSQVKGCAAVVWIAGPNVFAFRHGKEAVALKAVWRYKEAKTDDDKGDHALTLITSTRHIATEAWSSVKNIEFDYDFVDETGDPNSSFSEDHVYRLEPLGLVNMGLAMTTEAVADAYSSALVDSDQAPEVPAAATVETPADATAPQTSNQAQA